MKYSDSNFQWIKYQDENTTEIKHYLVNERGDRFAVIDKPEYRYRVRILDHSPFHTMSLSVAKSSGLHIFKEINKRSAVAA